MWQHAKCNVASDPCWLWQELETLKMEQSNGRHLSEDAFLNTEWTETKVFMINIAVFDS